MKLPPPANPNDKLRQYANFKKDLVDAFSMFDSVGDALDELRALRMKIGSSINEHIARFKLLAAAAEIDLNHALTIELFKETLIPALGTRMMNLEMPLKTLDDWYTWAIRLDHQQKKKMNGKEFYTHVQAISKDLDKEEKDKFLGEAQNAGF